MAGATMTAVVVLSAPGQKPPHNGGYAVRAASKKEVDMILHKGPGIDRAAAFADVLADAIKESALVLVAFGDGRAIDPSKHDVMQGTGDI